MENIQFTEEKKENIKVQESSETKDNNVTKENEIQEPKEEALDNENN